MNPLHGRVGVSAPRNKTGRVAVLGLAGAAAGELKVGVVQNHILALLQGASRAVTRHGVLLRVPARVDTSL